VAAQASNPIRDGQNFLRKAYEQWVGGGQQEASAARTQQNTERNLRLLQQMQEGIRTGQIADAEATSTINNILRPSLQAQARDVVDTGLAARQGEASIQSGLDASRGDQLRQTMETGVQGATQLLNTGAQAQNTVTRGQHESFSDFTAPHIKELAQMGINADRELHRAHFGETPFSQQILGHVAGQTAADRDFALTMAQQERPFRIAGTALQAGALAGLLFGR
jgi:hypothetical protein